MTKFIKNFVFQVQKIIMPANVLLVILFSWILIQGFKSDQSPQIETTEMSFWLVNQVKNTFGMKYYGFYQNHFYEIIPSKNEKNNLKLGQKYTVLAQFQKYDRNEILDEANSATAKNELRENYALNAGVWGKITILKTKTVESCDFSCKFVQFLDQVRNQGKVDILRSSCNLFGHDWQYLSPFENCTDIAGLLQGLLLGGSGGFTADMQQKFRVTGITHIVAISGFNITLIIVCLQFILERLKTSFKWQFGIIITVLTIFIALVGPSPSVLRAGLMSGMMLLARLLGRVCSATRALFLGSAVMLLYNPFFLFSVSFQLSFLATLGLLSYFETLPELDFQWFRSILETAWATIVANLYTLPVLINTFGYFSPLSVLPNIIILPFVPLIMFLDLLVFIPVVGVYLGIIPGLFCAWILGLVDWLSSWLPLFYLEKMSLVEIVLWYAFLYGLAWWIRRQTITVTMGKFKV
jgi:ComEC/Rec2-related protein